MPKAKISILVEVEYEMKPEHYPPGSSPQEMLNVDVAGADNEPHAMMDDPSAKWTITGQLLAP